MIFKKNAFIFLPIIFVLILSACAQDDVDEVMDLVPVLSGDEEIEGIVESGGWELCKNLTAKSEDAARRRQNRCFEEVAIAKNKEQVCWEILIDPDKPKDNSQLVRCVIKVAQNKRNPTPCDDLDHDDMQECYAAMAPIMKDASLCAKVDKGTRWEKCIKAAAIADKNFAVCANLENMIKQGGCQVAVAKEMGDSSLCPQIERDDFKNNCYWEVAVATGDQGLCENIIKPDRKQTCLENTTK